MSATTHDQYEAAQRLIREHARAKEAEFSQKLGRQPEWRAGQSYSRAHGLSSLSACATMHTLPQVSASRRSHSFGVRCSLRGLRGRLPG